MAENVIERIQNYISSLSDNIEKGMAAVTIRSVDKFALEFFNRVREVTKWERLQGSIELRKTFKKGRYGYRLLFDGYDERGEKRVPLQLIANVLNTGRVRTEGKIGGRRFVSPSLEGTKFISSSLDVLAGINPEIARHSDIVRWQIQDNFLITNAGDRLNVNDLESYIKLIEEGE